MFDRYLSSKLNQPWHLIVHLSKNDPMLTTYVKINEGTFQARALRGYAFGT